MSTVKRVLLNILEENGSTKYEKVGRLLRESGALGFGVEPDDVITKAVLDGDVEIHADGKETWVRKSAPFIVYEDLMLDQFTARAKKGEGVDVRWPNRVITRETITVISDVPGINVNHHGLTLWTPMKSVKFRKFF